MSDLRSSMRERDIPVSDEEIEARKQQAYMRRAVSELMKMHGLNKRTAASLMLTITSVVSLGPKSAR